MRWPGARWQRAYRRRHASAEEEEEEKEEEVWEDCHDSLYMQKVWECLL